METIDHRGLIPGLQCAQVDHFGRNSLVCKLPGGLARDSHGIAVGHYRYIAAFAVDTRLADRQFVVVHRNADLLGEILCHRFEKHHRILAFQRTGHQALGIAGI